MNASQLIQAMRARVASLSLPQILEAFEQTNALQGDEVPTVRGVLIDELERRDEAAFSAWMETADVALMDTPTHFYRAAL